MWSEPYLETCCRSALHRLRLSGNSGRPAANKDGHCLARLASLGLAVARGDARYEMTSAGVNWHCQVIERRPSHWRG
jgi:hypothetical protein